MASIYFITIQKKPKEVSERIKQIIPAEGRYQLAPDKWFVHFDGTARDLAEKSGVRGGEEFVGDGIVLPVTTYSGRASTELWDWLRVKGA